MSIAPQHRSVPGTGSSSRTASGERDQRDRLEQFHATLTKQVLTLTSSPAWIDWLRTAARFHHYSFGNTIAIWMQRPDATQVAGYRAWQGMGRQVRKGEKGIQILAPVTRRADPGHDEAGGPDRDTAPPSPAVGTDARETRQLVGVRIAHVFDYAQTDGEPLPQPIRPTLLTGHAPQNLWDGLARQVVEAGFELFLRAPPSRANGRTDWTVRQVLIRPELDPAQRVKTLAHELGHVMLHAPHHSTDPTTAVCRGSREVEAESVAFLVTSARGMDTAQYSSPYVAGWAQDSNDVEATLRHTASQALTTAHRILERLDRNNPIPPMPSEDGMPAIVQPLARGSLPPRGAAAPRWTPDPGMSP